MKICQWTDLDHVIQCTCPNLQSLALKFGPKQSISTSILDDLTHPKFSCLISLTLDFVPGSPAHLDQIPWSRLGDTLGRHLVHVGTVRLLIRRRLCRGVLWGGFDDAAQKEMDSKIRRLCGEVFKGTIATEYLGC